MKTPCPAHNPGWDGRNHRILEIKDAQGTVTDIYCARCGQVEHIFTSRDLTELVRLGATLVINQN